MIPGPIVTGMKKRTPLFAVLWLLLFFIAFFSFDLPNSQPTTSRWDIASNLHFLFLELIDPLDDDAAKNSGWQYFPQRFYPLGIALFMLIGATGLGGVLLRVILPRGRFTAGEFLFFAVAVGFSASSLLVLFCGLAGLLSRGFIGGLLTLCAVISIVVETIQPEGSLRGLVRHLRPPHSEADSSDVQSTKQIPFASIVKYACCGACLPFVLCMMLGASLPSTDFDVKEYHLEGPKEWFEQGKITFLPHNVYTSFPFLTEMLLLEAMVLTGDWWWGALAGKLTLMCFGPLTGWGVFLAARRWWGPTAGWLAMLIHLSTPWTYRISIIAYSEGGLSFYLLASLFAALLVRDQLSLGRDSDVPTTPSIGRECILTGFLAGSAMACKYTGLVSVIIPVGAFVKLTMFAHARCRGISIFNRTLKFNLAALALGVVLAIGPWLVKNLVETGNPVYPLAYSIFGGVDWDAELNAKWKNGHSPKNYALSDLVEKFVDVTLKSDWLNPLLFGLAPLALLVRRHRSSILLLWLFVAYLFGTWWLLTHRLDRFWVPLIPVVSLLAGVALTWNNHKFWICTATSAVVFATVYNLAFVTTGLCGNNAYLLDYDVARISLAKITSPEIVLLNHIEIPPGEHVLSIGDAEVFDAEFPMIYHTVFDKPILDDWWGIPQPDTPRSEWPQRDPEVIHAELRERKIAFVYVNWSEVLRYRLTYGYTDYVKPERFRVLQRTGVLGPNLRQNQAYADFDRLTDNERNEISKWAPELIVTIDGKKYVLTSEIMPVR